MRYLETKKLYLRELTDADEDQLLELDSDTEVMKYLTNGIPSSRHMIQKQMQRVSDELKRTNHQFGVWAAIEKTSNEFIGWFHLFPPRDDLKNYKKIFLGYRLKQKYWGQGFATEGSRALVEKAFTDFKANEVCAQAMKGNIASQKVMLKVGMTFVKTFLEEAFPANTKHAVLFSIKNRK